MGRTTIEWTRGDDGTPGRTWNPVTGCTKVSPGCDHCYAETMHERFNGKGSFANVTTHPGRLAAPLTWRKPCKVFVNSMSDLFHADIPTEFIAEVFAVMALAPQHTFQVLTKRHGRMQSLLGSGAFTARVADAAYRMARGEAGLSDAAERVASRVYVAFPGVGDALFARAVPWPLPNVWLGVSAESQPWADIRIPALLKTPAAVRWVSAEPLLGPLNLARYLPVSIFDTDPDADCTRCGEEWFSDRPTHEVVHRCGRDCTDPSGNGCDLEGEDTGDECPGPVVAHPHIGWVVAGGESGPGARPMDPEWARDLRDQCAAAGVPFLFKQWGAHDDTGRRVGKKAAGRELDGVIHDAYPVSEPKGARA